MPESPAVSARQLRSYYQSHEANDRALGHLLRSAEAIAGARQKSASLQAQLREVVQFVGCDHAVVLQKTAGALDVVASLGEALPVGAQLLAAGVFATALATQSQPQTRAQVNSRIRLTPTPVAAWERLMPLRLQQKTVGLLVLVRDQAGPSLSTQDESVLTVMSAFLALSLGARSAARSVSSQKDSAPLQKLTPREQQVLMLLPRGLSNAQMADELGVAVGTVKTHVERILYKLGLNSRVQAALLASQWGSV